MGKADPTPEAPVWVDITPKVVVLHAIRAAALANAVELVCHYGDMDGARLEDQAITMAKVFEAYLAGQEANGTT